MTNEELMQEAGRARQMAYAPYSGFTVGAALLTKDGKVYRGCNIENAAFGPSNCAERTAFFKAISEGEREFDRIAVCGGKEGTLGKETCAPCGVCRQVMMEFTRPQEFKIILYESTGGLMEVSLSELFPLAFGADNLG